VKQYKEACGGKAAAASMQAAHESEIIQLLQYGRLMNRRSGSCELGSVDNCVT
jgi:hypothetical protein